MNEHEDRLISRRQLLLAAAAAQGLTWLPATAHAAQAAQTMSEKMQDKSKQGEGGMSLALARVNPNEVLRFPKDFGSHPAFRTEWWYITGTLQHASLKLPLGFQITFFRTRVDSANSISESKFAAKQLVSVHTALSDVDKGRLLHEQRIARVGFGLTEATEGDTHINVRDWTLQRSGPVTQSQYSSVINGSTFSLDLRFAQTQALMLQGEAGFSRMAPGTRYATHYYSHPQMQVQGRVTYEGQKLDVTGRAWLDHEWGETLMALDAVGWDWIGMNLFDGSALMAFRVRKQDGTSVWQNATLRQPGKPDRIFDNSEIRFVVNKTWRSPASGVQYPIEWLIDLAGTQFTVRTRMPNQELDSRSSTGSIYWEGLSELMDAQGKQVGAGYLEMTGYDAPMNL